MFILMKNHEKMMEAIHWDYKKVVKDHPPHRNITKIKFIYKQIKKHLCFLSLSL